MKITIVTVYEPSANLGSFLQCYALKTFLEECGHEVYIVEKTERKLTIKSLLKINPKRAFFLRLKKGYWMIKDLRRFNLINQKKWNPEQFDAVIYGSDEIWNLHNPYFRDKLFWGIGVNVPKIGYGISVGHMSDEEFFSYPDFTKAISDFKVIYTRDIRSKQLLTPLGHVHEQLVCDPTMLVNLDKCSEDIKLPSKPYLLVYTYGLSNDHIHLVKKFAQEKKLQIVTPCFWHTWSDKVIECSALQFSTLIAGAEYVFTTTFHGAVFTMLNHKRCCIFSQRDKVQAIVQQLGVSSHLIPQDCTYEKFSEVMEIEFPTHVFENNLLNLRNYSQDVLKQSLSSINKSSNEYSHNN